MAEKSIICPRCYRESFHPQDIEERYCGHCHMFHREMIHQFIPLTVRLDDLEVFNGYGPCANCGQPYPSSIAAIDPEKMICRERR